MCSISNVRSCSLFKEIKLTYDRTIVKPVVERLLVWVSVQDVISRRRLLYLFAVGKSYLFNYVINEVRLEELDSITGEEFHMDSQIVLYCPLFSMSKLTAFKSAIASSILVS